MEKNIKAINIDIVIKNQDNVLLFEIKDPKRLHRNLLDDIKKEISIAQNDTVVIYPEQKIIDSQRVFLEDTSRIL